MEKLFEYLIVFFVFSLGMIFIRRWINELSAKIGEAVGEGLCAERRQNCRDNYNKKLAGMCKTQAEQWTVINHHGHRGLDGEGNQVVRTE